MTPRVCLHLSGTIIYCCMWTVLVDELMTNIKPGCLMFVRANNDASMEENMGRVTFVIYKTEDGCWQCNVSSTSQVFEYIKGNEQEWLEKVRPQWFPKARYSPLWQYSCPCRT